MSSTFHPKGGVVDFEEHTADIWMTAKGKDPEEVFWKMLQGLYGLVSSTFTIAGNKRSFNIEFDVENLETAIQKVLKEALFMLDAESTIIIDPSFQAIVHDGRTAVRFMGSAVSFQIPEGQGGFEVKAVTHHGIEFKEDDGAWYCRVLLDI